MTKTWIKLLKMNSLMISSMNLTFKSCNQQDQETQEATMFVSHKKLIEFQLNFN